MSRIIQDSLLKKSVIIVKGRDHRPFINAKEEKECPFCEQNRHLLSHRYIQEEVYGICIAANKYPICNQQEGMYGIHDVVVDTKYHHLAPYQFTLQHWETLLQKMQQRCKQLFQDSKIQVIQIFKNFGGKAGASISHSHWQIVALEEKLHSQFYNMSDMKQDPSQCIPKEYTLIESATWKVGFPKTPFMRDEIWLVPNTGVTKYEQLDESQIKGLAIAVLKLLNAYEKYCPNVSYNICFSQSLRTSQKDKNFFIRFIPREENIAGFELATNCFIVTKDPAECTQEILKYIT